MTSTMKFRRFEREYKVDGKLFEVQTSGGWASVSVDAEYIDGFRAWEDVVVEDEEDIQLSDFDSYPACERDVEDILRGLLLSDLKEWIPLNGEFVE